MVRPGGRLVALTVAAIAVTVTVSGAAYAQPRDASAALSAACKAELESLVAEALSFAKDGSYVTAAELVSHRLLKRRPQLFDVAVNADGGVTISPTKPGGCPKALAKTLRGPTVATTLPAATSSASLVAACVELDRISREDAVGLPGNANRGRRARVLRPAQGDLRILVT